MSQLNKYFQGSQIEELKRSQIHPAGYNPRIISDEGKKELKRSIKRFGVVGGIVINKQTGYTIVGGHQKVFILDEINKYEEGKNDYLLRAEVISVDVKTEKELNVMLNNASAQGEFDYDKLRLLLPDIDYKNAGLSDADLSMIGVDNLYQTDAEIGIADELDDLMQEVEEEHQIELEQRAIEREASKAAEPKSPEMTREEKVQHMKDVKQQVKEAAIEEAKNMDAYVILSFNTFEAKSVFCENFGYSPYDKFIKGEDFEVRVNGFSEDEE